jgi:hypothetical protein
MASLSIAFLFCGLLEFAYLAILKPSNAHPILHAIPPDPWEDTPRLRDRK